MKSVERAPAKLNLTLSVTGRRDDGYHTLESLVLFARDVHDELMVLPGADLALTVAGATAADAGDPRDNLVLTAVRAVQSRREAVRTGAFFLKKNVPVAAGLGGGSADAAAALRLLARINDWAQDDAVLVAAAHATGADVAVCLSSRACIMRGIGDQVGAALDMAVPHVLLVNPRRYCATPAVFQALALPAGKLTRAASRRDGDIVAGWMTMANDLQPAAIALVPEIATILAVLGGMEGCQCVRMSGSGATCFGVFSDAAACAAAQADMERLHPEWWSARTALM
ncbi:MAG: 4-(cytidine 5'-diphospho)-2-C-methyl-D-erythritol kinase [Beijerinckiaceae bacterium]